MRSRSALVIGLVAFALVQKRRVSRAKAVKVLAPLNLQRRDRPAKRRDHRRRHGVSRSRRSVRQDQRAVTRLWSPLQQSSLWLIAAVPKNING